MTTPAVLLTGNKLKNLWVVEGVLTVRLLSKVIVLALNYHI